MSAIVVTPQMLLDSSRSVAAKAGEIEGSLGGLAAHVHGLTTEWQGMAQSQFQGLYDQWQTSARQLHDALIGISNLLNQAGITYADSEQAIARTFAV